jgi:histidyl-tRNA synthetase
MEAIGLGGEDKAGQRLIVLRAIDKLDRLGREGVRDLLGEGRKDESGDFTKGAGLSPAQIDQLGFALGLQIAAGTPDDGLPYWMSYLGSVRAAVEGSTIGNTGVDELIAIAELVHAADYLGKRVQISTSVVRGLEYYTGPVYEAELTFTTPNENGQPVRFGSVGGGGRYDGLIGRFRPEPVPATGFSIGVSRFLAALQAVKSPIVTGAEAPGPVVVLVMDRERMADYQRMVATLRNGGVRAELYFGGSGMKAQMKYADRRKSPCVVIQGSDERARGEVQIKDLALGTALAASGRDRADYLDKQAEAQFSTSEGNLLTAVRQVIERAPK